MQESSTSARTSDRYAHRVDVRFHEIDWFGHVSHMWYLTYFDAAMAAYFRARAVPQSAVFLQIVRVEIEWKKAGVRRGDHVDVEVRPIRIGNSSFTLEFEVLHGEQRSSVAVGRTVYVCVSADQDGGASSRSIPPILREALESDLS
jgi:acyl-CoA thioester hydrolase